MPYFHKNGEGVQWLRECSRGSFESDHRDVPVVIRPVPPMGFDRDPWLEIDGVYVTPSPVSGCQGRIWFTQGDYQSGVKQQTMTTLIAVSPLPALDSSQVEDLQLNEFPRHLTAYQIILRAEQLAVKGQAKEDTISARIIGYLLLEFHAQRHIFGDKPCTELVRRAVSPSQNPDRPQQHHVIFDIGKLYRDKLLRACPFSRSFS